MTTSDGDDRLRGLRSGLPPCISGKGLQITEDQRYYSNQFARFMSVDRYKASAGGADPTTPQSWNRYAYVRGDPINANDPHGMNLEWCDEDCFWEGDPPPGCFVDPYNPVPNPACYVGILPFIPTTHPKPPTLDCDIALDYHSAYHTPGNHSFLFVTGSLGTFIIEGEPTKGAASGLLLGYWGTLAGFLTPGSNGRDNTDNPNNYKINKQGPTLDDTDCLDTLKLLGLWSTSTFNQASGAPPGGWTYSPVTFCLNQSLGLCTNDANSSSYASFLLYEIGELSFFGQPPRTPGWGQLNP